MVDDDVSDLASEWRGPGRHHFVVQLVERLDDSLYLRRPVAPPDGHREDDDLGVQQLLKYAGPLVALTYVGVRARHDAMVNQLDDFTPDALAPHPAGQEFAERLGVRQSRLLERAEQYRRLHVLSTHAKLS